MLRRNWPQIATIVFVVVSAIVVVAVTVAWNRAPAPGAGPATFPKPLTTSLKTDPFKYPPRGSKALFIGDSWTAGFVADPEKGFAYLLAKKSGWDATMLAVPGSAITFQRGPTEPSFTQRIDTLKPEYDPAIVFVQGGINDTVSPRIRGVRADLETFLKAVKAAYPKAEIVVIGPFNRKDPMPSTFQTVNNAMLAAAASQGAFWVSPITAKWITAANIPAVIEPGGDHPGNKGHAYLASILASTLDGMIGNYPPAPLG